MTRARHGETLGRGLTRAKADCSVYRAALQQAADADRQGPSLRDPACSTSQQFAGDDVTLGFFSLTMPDLARFLRDWMRAPVFDETGLSGEYDVTLSTPRDSIPIFHNGTSRTRGHRVPADGCS